MKTQQLQHEHRHATAAFNATPATTRSLAVYRACMVSGRRVLDIGLRPIRSFRVRSKAGEEEPNWDEEMSIFKQRTMRPNQVATLKELESRVSVGKVGWRR
jgi:hypothetical protein